MEQYKSYKEKESLYNLLPAVYRQREFELPEKPLKELLGVIEEQVAVLESDIERLYDNWFIETCQEWVVPYIGDLLGVKGIRPAGNAAFSQRAWVANTLSHRRRKGTLSVIEQLAHDVTDWDARAVEFMQVLGTTQNMNHTRPANAIADIHQAGRLDMVGSPFDTTARTADVRRIASERGFCNIQNIGIFLWRLKAYPVTDSPAHDHGDGRFSFNQLGYDVPLFNLPWTEQDVTHIAEEVNVPGPIRRRALHETPDLYYGRSFSISRGESQVDASKIISCDLTGWKNRPPAGKVAVDPVLGRIVFPSGEKPKDVRVSYHYGFSSELGGGQYPQSDPKEEGLKKVAKEATRYYISKRAGITKPEERKFPSLRLAIDGWKKKPGSAVFEITDSDVYEEALGELSIPNGATVVIRAAEGTRPVIKLAGSLAITSAKGSGASVVLEWLTVHCKDAAIVVRGDLKLLKVRHCTLVPGSADSIQVQGGNDQLAVSLERTVCGSIAMTGTDARLEAVDSIIDGMGRTATSCYRASVESCTVFGSANVALLDLASNSIFTGPVIAERLQTGCVRFSYMPVKSRVPRRYRCQPAEAQEGETLVRPHFTSERYGDPGYAQLHANTDVEILQGAENGNEMGAFGHLYQRHRLGNLAACLDEYLRFGLEAGVFMVT